MAMVLSKIVEAMILYNDKTYNLLKSTDPFSKYLETRKKHWHDDIVHTTFCLHGPQNDSMNIERDNTLILFKATIHMSLHWKQAQIGSTTQ